VLVPLKALAGVNETNTNTSTKMRPLSATSKPFSREMFPQSHRTWLVEKQTQEEALQTGFTGWMEDVSKNEKLFREHVYENKDLVELDIRQHRGRLLALLADGEALSLAFYAWGETSGKIDHVVAYVNLLDQKLKELFTALWEWHGPVEAQSDIPESFKQAAKEAEAGKIVDLDI
jgi:hypothetical protein